MQGLGARFFLGVGALALCCQSAWAATAEVVVKATVTSECSFKTGAGATLAFPTVSNNAAGGAEATTTLHYHCSRGLPYSLKLDDVPMVAGAGGRLVRRMTSATTKDQLEYSVSWNLPAGLKGRGFADPHSEIKLVGRITQEALRAVSPGDYTGQLRITLLPVSMTASP